MLDVYTKMLQRFVRDRQQVYLNPTDLIDYVNRARRDIAGRTQSIRRLTPVSGSLSQITITNPGSGYTAPTVTVSAPDMPSGSLPFPAGAQATAIATEAAGLINNIAVTYGGSGYFQPTITIDDPTGIGAAAEATISSVNQTEANQEIYRFADIDLSVWPGVGSVFAVKSVSIIYSGYRYSLPMYSFSEYQANIRQYPNQYLYVPTMGSQYGQGTDGSLYLYPIASSVYQMELDCFCLPSDLEVDEDVEALPQPWQDAVPFYAAHLAYLELQNLNAAEYYLKLFTDRVHSYSAYARPGRRINPYGRY